MSLHDRTPRRRPRFQWMLGVGLMVWTGLAGCGPADSDKARPVYPVTGSVLLPDGKPLSSGQVVFVAKDGINSIGTLAADGTFSLKTGASGDGAPAGDYKVRLEADQTALKSGAKSAKTAQVLPFPENYGDEDTSGLTATVKPEPNKLEPFKLTKSAAAAASPTRSSKVTD